MAPEGHADAGGEPLAERAGRHLQPRQRVHVGVALQAGVGGVERLQLVDREVAAHGENGVEGDRGVPLAEDEAIPLRPIGLAGVDAHLIEVEGHQEIGGGQRPAEVPGSRVVDGLHDQLARLDAQAAQLGEGRAGADLLGTRGGAMDDRHCLSPR